MKKALFFILILFYSSVFAEDGLYSPVKIHSGFYAGFLLGSADLHYHANDFSAQATSIDSVGFAGRVFAGYKIFRYFGAEIGYDHYQDAEFNGLLNNSEGSSDLQQAALTYQFRFMLPFKSFELFIKAGGATVFRGDLESTATIFHKSDQKTSVVMGVGVGWLMTPNWELQAEYSHILSAGTLPNSDFYAGGISYHFGLI